MTEDFVIFGAGPAGLSAASTLAAAGKRVMVFDQRSTIGGAVHRQPIAGASPVKSLRHDKARWERLAAVARHPNITFHHQVVFTGLDGTGLLVAEERRAGTALKVRAKGVIFALGALEIVRPLPGWDLAGVSTAGGLQVQMKETGTPPKGEVILAGSGPLLVVLAAQMASLGNPPKAIVELGNPTGLRPGLRMLARQPMVALQGLGPLMQVLTSQTRYLRGAELRSIRREGAKLIATIQHLGRDLDMEADLIGLHHGIRPNDIGLPLEDLAPKAGHPIILRAGDCDQALGADAAVTSGADKARRLLALVEGRKDPGPTPEMSRHIQSQKWLWQSFAASVPPRALKDLPDETILCRCERRTVGDLKALTSRQDQLAPREIKHNGRFGMGSCQGRFCAHNTLELLSELRGRISPTPQPDELTGRRWPSRPVAIASLLNEAPVIQD